MLGLCRGKEETAWSRGGGSGKDFCLRFIKVDAKRRAKFFDLGDEPRKVFVGEKCGSVVKIGSGGGK
jgi:hypothetical protein